MEKRWHGPASVCDICRCELVDEYFVDGRTKMGPWALMCPSCHRKYGVGLGTGFGQKYRTIDRVKIAG